MNIPHLKYAVEIAKAGSINKASETLLIAQPNLSRSIKELESDLGITIFDRSSRGMFLTPEGEEFIGYAKMILSQIDEVEARYKVGLPSKQRFSVSVPRASYIAEAFSAFSREITKEPAEILYNETNSVHAVTNILESDYKLGIVRYIESSDKLIKEMLEEKGLGYELVAEFRYVLIMNENCELAKKGKIYFSDLEDYIEVAHADPITAGMPLSTMKSDNMTSDNIERKIYVFERGSQFGLLSNNEETFMWVSPVPPDLLKKYGLVQRECVENRRIYKDLLIYRKGYRFTKLDNLFITELCNSKRKYLKDI